MEPENEIASGLSLQEYLHILRRRRAIILQAFVLISVVGIIVTLMQKPVYQASAQLLVEGQAMTLNTADSSNPLSQLFALGQEQNVATQVEVLQAQPMLEKVAKEAGGVAKLTVAPVTSTAGPTNIIEADAESTNPKVAAAAPNALLRLYIEENADQSLNEIKAAEDFARTQGADAHRRLLASEAELAQFKQKYHITDIIKNRDAQLANISALTGQSQSANFKLTTLQAQIAAVQSLLAQQPETVATQMQASNTAIAALQDKAAQLRVQRVAMTQEGGLTDQAPQVIALDAQIAELNRQIKAQPALTTSESRSPNTIRQSLRARLIDLRSQVAPVQAEVAASRNALANAKSHVGNYAAWEVTQADLLREHDSAAAQDKTFQDQLATLSLREKAHHSTARIIQSAQVPTEPIRPKKLTSILFACLIGLFVGVCLALLQEFLDDRINSVEDANRALGLPSLGHVPALTSDDAKLLPQMKGLDPASESYRVLRTNIHFASIDAPARTLLVTSSNPGEGKTTTAANLAFAMAMDGKRVILVDTDLRRPSMHKLLSLPTMPGLTDVLLDHATLAETLLEHEDMPNLVALMSGSTPPNPGELLNSRKFRNLVQELSEQADIVIFDSPPVLVAADAAILASQMDGTILVVETGETKKGAARQTLKSLHQARANILGVAYNKMRAIDGSGYYYYQYQYKTAPMIDGAPAHGTNGRKQLTATAADPAGAENAEAVNHWRPADHDNEKSQ